MTPPTLSRFFRATSISAILRSAASRSAHPRPVGTGVRLPVLVADEGDNRPPRRQPVGDAFREFHAIRLLALAGDEALSRSTAIELLLDEGLVDSCPGAQSLDRAAHERTVTRPEDRGPVSRTEDVHPTTA